MKTKVKTSTVPDQKIIDVAQLRAKSAIGKDRLCAEHMQACLSQMNARATLGFHSSHHEVDDVKLATLLVNELKKIPDLYVETSNHGTKTIITTRW